MDYKEFGITKQQYKFCEEYLTNGFNQTKAAIAAGYKEKYACSVAAHLLQEDGIKKYIDFRLSALTNKFDEVMACLTSIALGQDTDQIPLLEQGSQYLADKKIDAKDRVKAASEIIKYKQFNDKLQREDEDREYNKKNNNVILENIFRQLRKEENEELDKDMELIDDGGEE